MKGNFNQLINGDIPVLIDFHAEWCGPCKMLAPVIQDVSKALDGKVRIIKIDVDKNQQVAQKYQVRGVPTLALFKNGEVVWKEAGVRSKQEIINIINQNL